MSLGAGACFRQADAGLKDKVIPNSLAKRLSEFADGNVVAFVAQLAALVMTFEHLRKPIPVPITIW